MLAFANTLIALVLAATVLAAPVPAAGVLRAEPTLGYDDTAVF
jgi:hypothetical protein